MLNQLTGALALCVLSLTLAGCRGSNDTEETTADSWTGKTYLLTVPQSNWTMPRGIGAEISDYVPSFILEVDASGRSIMVGAAQPNATPDSAVQNPCSPTYTFDFSANYPQMQLGPAAIRVHLLNPAENSGEDNVQETGEVYELTMTDILPSGTRLSTSGVLTATMDLTDLAPLFTALGAGADRDSLCEEFGAEYGDYPGGRCAACPNSEMQPYCLTITGEQLGAVEAPNLALAPVDEASRPESCNPERIPKP